jgi:hypothetical protein
MPIAAFVKQVYVLPFFPSFLTLCPVLDAKNVREKALREKNVMAKSNSSGKF